MIKSLVVHVTCTCIHTQLLCFRLLIESFSLYCTSCDSDFGRISYDYHSSFYDNHTKANGHTGWYGASKLKMVENPLDRCLEAVINIHCAVVHVC